MLIVLAILVFTQDLEKDLILRNNQLVSLVKRCGVLQSSLAETEPLASQLYEHLVILQRSFEDAGAQLHSRLLHLQV